MDPVDTNDASVSARDIGEQVCVATKSSQRYDNCSDTLVYASGTSFALRNKQTCIFKQHMSDTAVHMSGEHAGSQILLGLGKSRRGTDCYNNLGWLFCTVLLTWLIAFPVLQCHNNCSPKHSCTLHVMLTNFDCGSLQERRQQMALWQN